MTAWTEAGWPSAWETTLEEEFDANERDSWEALAEFREAICPKCGSLKSICSNPGGITGEGYHLRQEVCWPTAILEATQRRVERRFKDEQPNLQGMLTPDGVLLSVSMVEHDGEDILGLDERPELQEQLEQGS